MKANDLFSLQFCVLQFFSTFFDMYPLEKDLTYAQIRLTPQIRSDSLKYVVKPFQIADVT